MRAVYLLIVVRLQLEERCLQLVYRLVDNSLLQKFSSLYLVVAQHVVRSLEDMVDFFTKQILYIAFVQLSHQPLHSYRPTTEPLRRFSVTVYKRLVIGDVFQYIGNQDFCRDVVSQFYHWVIPDEVDEFLRRMSHHHHP